VKSRPLFILVEIMADGEHVVRCRGESYAGVAVTRRMMRATGCDVRIEISRTEAVDRRSGSVVPLVVRPRFALPG
jgi:hypothetical protein